MSANKHSLKTLIEQLEQADKQRLVLSVYKTTSRIVVVFFSHTPAAVIEKLKQHIETNYEHVLECGNLWNESKMLHITYGVPSEAEKSTPKPVVK